MLVLAEGAESEVVRQVLAAGWPAPEVVIAESAERAREALRCASFVAVVVGWPAPASVAVLHEVLACVARILVVPELSEGALRGAHELGATLCMREPAQLGPLIARASEAAARQREHELGYALLTQQRDILAAIAAGEPLVEVLNKLVVAVERWGDGRGSIVLLDRASGTVRHGAAPGLPPTYVAAIDGLPIGPEAGSCGTAAFLGEPVHVRDIAAHPAWLQYRDVALAANLRACWSTPILASDLSVLGTFAVYYDEPRDASPRDQRIVSALTHLAAIAISREQDLRAVRSSEEALRRSEYELRSIFESAVVGVTLIDPATRPRRFNAALVDLLGFPPEELRRTRLKSLVHPEDLPVLERESRALDAGERDTASADIRMVRKDGEAIWVRVHSSRLSRTEPEQPFAVLVIEDVTNRKRLEQAVLAEERLLAGIYQSVAEAITYFKVEPDECYRLLSANPAFCQAFGVQPEQIVGKRLEEIITVSPIDSVKRHYRMAIEERRSVHWEEVGYFPHGAEYVEAVASPVQDDAGQCTSLVVVSRVVTDRKRAAARLAEQAALLDRTRDAIVRIGVDRTVRFWNASAVRMYGYAREEAIGRTLESLLQMDPAVSAKVEAQLLREDAFTGELVQHARDGRALVVDGSLTLLRDEHGQPESVLAIYTDASEKKKLEEQVMFAQRMEGLGTLAGGIAHDFNNILAAIVGYLELAMNSLPVDAPARTYLEVVQTASERAGALVQQILTFSRRRPSQRAVCRLSPVVREVLGLMRATLPRMIDIEVSYAEGELDVIADTSQIHQIIMNLATNAAQALGQHGTLSVRLEPVVLRERLMGVASEVPPGAYMCLTVSDDGVGMEAATQRRIFDPFFTTKAPGMGTGLGLPVVLGIVRDHGGTLRVVSAPGRGTTFDVYLPQASAQPARMRPVRAAEVRGRGERILCVDDEATLVQLARAFLEGLGYRVEAFEDPLEAYRAFAARPLAYAAIVTDFAMREMSGIDFAEAARAVRPAIPIVLVSGHLDEAQRARAERLAVSAILEKPDYLDPLAQVLHRLLAPSLPATEVAEGAG